MGKVYNVSSRILYYNMSFEHNGYEWVRPEASGRRGGYWRKIPATRKNPTYGQRLHRLRFSEAAMSTRGLYGTTKLADSREVSKSALTLGNILRSPSDQSIREIPMVSRMPFAEINDIPKPAQDKGLLRALLEYSLAERERLEAERLAQLKRESQLRGQLREERLREVREREKESQRLFEEHIRRLDSLSAKHNAEWDRLQERIDDIKRKIEKKTEPKVNGLTALAMLLATGTLGLS